MDDTLVPAYPACPEDGLIDIRTVPVCGPAVDDGYLVPDNGDCPFLIGLGQFDGGYWTSYGCTGFEEFDTVALPDTAVGSDPLPLAGALLLLAGLVLLIRRSVRR